MFLRYRSLPAFPMLDTGEGGGSGNPADPANPANPPAAPFATFPDAAAFAARMDREAQARLEAIAKEAGYESAAAMQLAIKAAKEREDQEKTDLERAQEATRNAEAQRDQALQDANARLIRAEIKALCLDPEINIIDADAAYKLMDLSAVTIDAQGSVTGAKEALTALLTAMPFLKRQAAANVGGGSNPPGGGNDPAKNPWATDSFNLTEQARILREDPARAQQLQAAAKKG